MGRPVVVEATMWGFSRFVVDMTEEFTFLVTKLSPYCDR